MFENLPHLTDTTKGAPAEVKLSEMLPADEVGQAWKRGLVWQYHRLQELLDQLEHVKDALQEERLALAREREAWAEMAHKILSATSQRLLEQELEQTAEEFERKVKRRKRYPHPGGFDPRKPFKK